MEYKKTEYERELVVRVDNIMEIINNAMGMLPLRYTKNFLSKVEKTVKRESRHWLKMSKYKGVSPAYDDIRAKFSRKMHFKRGEPVSIEDLAELFSHTPKATLMALMRLEEEFDFNLIKPRPYAYYSDDYFFVPVPEESYKGRIPINGKPILDSNPRDFRDRYLVNNGLISRRQLSRLVGDDFSGSIDKKIFRECIRQLAAEVRERGYCWKNEGYDHSCFGKTSDDIYLTHENADEIFEEFIKKTRLPVGTLEDKPVLAYHPKLIRKLRKSIN